MNIQFLLMEKRTGFMNFLRKHRGEKTMKRTAYRNIRQVGDSLMIVLPADIREPSGMKVTDLVKLTVNTTTGLITLKRKEG